MIAQRMKLEGLMGTEKQEEIYPKFEAVQDEVKEIRTMKSLEAISKRSKMEKTVIVSSDQFDSIDEVDIRIEENIERHVGSQWRCKLCRRICRDKTNVKEHVEIHFDGLSFPCKRCDKSFRARKGLRQHRCY